LKQLRKEMLLTQKQVAEKLNVVESCYANWEQGRTEPNIEFIKKLCAIYNVSSDILLGLNALYD
ncbi:MAG: helix-turn-helix domain-containing protein, partial [Clostridia bacterium]|nr:helix-turn-helix domain-containing protein [Clostridia bacterium]